MEASSHGLIQHRLDGLKFSSGIFTNISQDHLDYHKNFKEYFKAKLYLFENLIGKKGNVITDETLPEFKRIKKKLFFFSFFSCFTCIMFYNM